MTKPVMCHAPKNGVERVLTLSPLGDPVDRDPEFLHLGRQMDGSSAISPRGTQVVLQPGDLVLCDPDQPHFLPLGGDCRVTVFRMSLRHLAIPEPELRGVLGVRVPGGEGMGALVSVFLSALAAGTDALGTRVGDQLVRGVLDLVPTLVEELHVQEGGRPADAASPVRDEMLARIKEYIDDHLADRDLSPTAIAQAHHISVRYLHKLFQSTGVTVNQWVRQRRLHLSRRELGRMSNRRLTVAAVARRSGFISHAHFSRVFRNAYGMSPSEWQTRRWSAQHSPVAEAGSEGRRGGVPAAGAAEPGGPGGASPDPAVTRFRP
ncbi:AraC family transcriptional regulator [Streptomyces sp. NPDC093252]|uniref:AraC family transcriptional regulator n=1 Tax=Streptomyces sp. NPDC093252 TaxID=3154980 RepID=UPI0034340D91